MLQLLILLAFLGLLWLVSSKRWKRQLIIPASIVLLCCVIATSPLIVTLETQGLVAFLPADSGAKVDAIVVLGRGEVLQDSRVEATLKLWNEKRASRIFMSGMTDTPKIIEMLTRQGIPRQSLSGESCSQNTEENALFSAVLLRPQGIQQILLITDAPHMLRSLLVFRSFGFTVIPHISSLPPTWTSTKQAIFLFREYLGLIGYALSGHFQQQPSSKFINPPADVAKKLLTWNCRY